MQAVIEVGHVLVIKASESAKRVYRVIKSFDANEIIHEWTMKMGHLPFTKSAYELQIRFAGFLVCEGYACPDVWVYSEASNTEIVKRALDSLVGALYRVKKLEHMGRAIFF